MNRPKGGRIAVVVSRFNESVTRRLLDGALARLNEAGYADAEVEVVWVPGAFELPIAVRRALGTNQFRAAVALGAVIRGETPHFDYVCSEAARGLAQVAADTGTPVGFGLLTCDTMSQAMARSGGEAGNKGAEAAAAAVETAEVLDELDPRAES